MELLRTKNYNSIGFVLLEGNLKTVHQVLSQGEEASNAVPSSHEGDS